MKKILGGLLLAAWLSPAAAMEWTMSTNEPEANYHTLNTKQFAEDVSRLSEGELTIKVVPNATLLKRTELKRGVQTGIVPIGEVFISALGTERKVFEVDSIPFIAPTFDKAHSLWVASKPVLESALAKDGLMMLYSVPWPPQGIYIKNQVDEMADFSGVRVRANNPATTRMFELMGAIPVTVASTEISQAFSTGVISGMITSASTGVDTQAWDFVDNYYDLRASIPKNFAIVSKSAFDKLTPKSQEAVRQATALAEERGWKLAIQATDEATARLAAAGMTVAQTPPALATGLADIAATLLDDWKATAGDDGVAILKAYDRP